MSVKPGVKYENIIYEKCVNKKCEKTFMIPLNYKLIYLSRTFKISEMRYKHPAHIKNYFSGVLDFIDINDYVNQDLIDHPEKIVKFDEGVIDKCDILVAIINQPTFGTLGEIHYARHKKIPIYAINPNRVYMNEPWLKYIVDDLCDDIDKCFYDLVNLAVKEYNFKYE